MAAGMLADRLTRPKALRLGRHICLGRSPDLRVIAWLAFPVSQWRSSLAYRLQLRGQSRHFTGFPLSPRRESQEPKQHHIGALFDPLSICSW